MVGYNETKIYKVVCNITGQVYISHTTKKYLSQRLSYHLSKFKLYRDGLCGFCPVFRIIVGGDYYIELIENCNCNSKEEVLQRQNHYVCSMDCLNKQALFINPAPPIVRGYGF